MADIKHIVRRIETVQIAEQQRNDNQDKALKKMRKMLHAA